MRLKGQYALTPEVEDTLRRTQQKGIGAVVLILVMVCIAGAFLPKPPLQTVVVAVGTLSILFVVRTYSLAVANQRLTLGRLARKAQNAPAVIAALLPFASGGLFNTRSRFDRTGEAHYLLAWAAKRENEAELLAYCQVFLAKFRKGEWSKKALKL